MYDLVIVDDSRKSAEATAAAVSRFPGAAGLFRVRLLGGLDELRAIVSEGASIDIAIMDVVFEGEQGGINAVRWLADRGYDSQIIYATGYIEYCTSVYETDHAYFLTKPLSQADLDRALSKALGNLAKRVRGGALVLKSGGRVVSVPHASIRFVESIRRKVRVHTADSAVESYSSLADIEEALPPSFVRCHKSFIVNLDQVAEIDKDDVVLRSGERVPVSQRHRRHLRDRLVAHLMAKG